MFRTKGGTSAPHRAVRIQAFHILMAITHTAPAAIQTASFDDRRAVRFWLIAVAGLSFLMVLVGGATRLTEAGPAAIQTASFGDRRAVRFWLIAVAGLIFLMVLVGGATRLTESGLSITQWKPVTGVLPPLSARERHSE